MIDQTKLDELKKLVDEAKKIVVIQADNPDGDSLGSSLALEQILSDLGKEVSLYCGINMPTYLRYLSGWDRVQDELPKDFDLSIIVDCSSISLMDTLTKFKLESYLKNKPCVIIDHHQAEGTIPFADTVIVTKAVATGELIYDIAKKLSWAVNLEAMNMLSISIMSDSLGLTTEATTAHSIRTIADLVEGGVNLSEIDDSRRQLMRKSPQLIKYKGELLQRIEYFNDNRIAIVTIPWEEIEKYSQAYNPSMLVIDDMRLTEGTDIAIAFKLYANRVTAKIRCNHGARIAADLATHFGGGGHVYASGFKVELDSKSFEVIKLECIKQATILLEKNDAKNI